MNPKVGKTFSLKTKQKLREGIKTKMEEQNYNFTPVQKTNRWETLERAFKKKQNTTEKRGAKCAYEK